MMDCVYFVGSIAVSVVLKHDNHVPTAPGDLMLLPLSSPKQDCTAFPTPISSVPLLIQSATVSHNNLVAGDDQSSSQPTFVDDKRRKLLREHCALIQNLTYKVPDDCLDEMLHASESYLRRMESNSKVQPSSTSGVPDFQVLKRFHKK